MKRAFSNPFIGNGLRKGTIAYLERGKALSLILTKYHYNEVNGQNVNFMEEFE